MPELRPFHSDGCTMSPDFNFRACCIAHDRAYWAGGTAKQRLAADTAFRECVTAKGHPVLAWFYFWGVRAGGAPFWPSIGFWKGSRWGYGRAVRTGYDKPKPS